MTAHRTYPEAAEYLGLPNDRWLRRNISKLPHRKFGREVKFTDEDLEAISQAHLVEPGDTVITAASNLMSLRPSRATRSRRAA